jgi:hypothetical protein
MSTMTCGVSSLAPGTRPIALSEKNARRAGSHEDGGAYKHNTYKTLCCQVGGTQNTSRLSMGDDAIIVEKTPQ